MENYAQRKILFRDTKWLLSNMSYRGRDDQGVWACAVDRTTWPLQCQLAPWKSNEALFIRFLWSEGVKPSEIYRRMKVQYRDSCLSQERVCEWVERFQNGRQNVSDEHRSGRPVSVASETVKQQVELFSRGHTQTCGQVDQVFCEAGRLCRKMRHKQFL